MDIIQTAFDSYKAYLEFVKNNPIPIDVQSTTTSTKKNTTTGGSGIGVLQPTPVSYKAIEHAQTVISGMNTNPLETIRKIVSGTLQRGIHDVPETGFYMLHKHETVSPSGKEVQSGGNITIQINNPIVRNENDIIKIAKAVENVSRANLIDKRTGKNKYRMM